jgi:phage portal protein BeeE
VKLEQALYRDLLTETQRRKLFFKFNTNGLMRGDTAARTQYYNVMRQNGVMSADDIRELEDMNHIPDGLGGLYLVNGNMITLENAKLNVPKGAQKEVK